MPTANPVNKMPKTKKKTATLEDLVGAVTDAELDQLDDDGRDLANDPRWLRWLLKKTYSALPSDLYEVMDPTKQEIDVLATQVAVVLAYDALGVNDDDDDDDDDWGQNDDDE